MQERRKYEQWLDDLERKKDSTPTKVFDRVRQDYMGRLQTVMEQLKEHTKTLQDHARSLHTRLRELEAAEQAHTEEQAEAELRANVGEITHSEWESSSRKAARELNKIRENQEVVADELNQIRDVLDEKDDDESSSPRTAAEFDELEFLKSVVGAGPTTSELPVRKPTPPSAPEHGTPASSRPVADRQSTQRLAEPTSEPRPMAPKTASSQPSSTPAAEVSTGAPAQTSPRTPAPVAAVSPPQTTERDTPAPSPTVTPSKVPQVPSDNALGISEEDAPEQPRTLKCSDCGTMNYASEWYCEKCGAELANI